MVKFRPAMLDVQVEQKQKQNKKNNKKISDKKK